MIDPSPYRSVAVASTFSPRFEQVLAESKENRNIFDAKLCLVFVGKKIEETSAKFAAALERISLPKNSPIHYEQGDPATAILRAIERHDIDLIVAGALEKEVVLHPFLGNVARRLLREGRSSVILFTHPAREPEPLRKIVFLVEYSEHGSNSLRRALHLAARENSERVYVVRLITTFDEARAKKEGTRSEEHTSELQ